MTMRVWEEEEINNANRKPVFEESETESDIQSKGYFE